MGPSRVGLNPTHSVSFIERTLFFIVSYALSCDDRASMFGPAKIDSISPEIETARG